MNRALMDRQMFKMGGVAKSAFPDLSGDGQVTQKDILMGRGVISKQEGGMIPADPMMMPAEQPMMMPPEAGADPAVPAALEQVFGRMQSQVDGIENSDDIEGMINAVRGDQQPIEARRAELAEFVGPDDAQQTPESVLALVQPVMQLASVDQGIGSLAAEEMMDTPVEGPMAEGIMSTVNMAPEMPMEVGNQPPVNFRQGGAVVSMKLGGNPAAYPTPEIISPLDIKASTRQQKEILDEIIGARPDQAANLAEQEKLAKSQMLFDIANTALAFATPGSRQMSPAERLAEAAQETQLLDKIGARSQNVLDLKRAEDLAAYEDRMAKGLSAYQTATTAAAQERTIQSEAYQAMMERAQKLTILDLTQNFQKKQQESDQDHRLRLQGVINEAQEQLVALRGQEDRKSEELRGKIQENLSKLGYIQSKSLLADKAMYEEGRQLSAQEHAMSLANRQGEIESALVNLRSDRSKEGQRLSAELTTQLDRNRAELSENSARLAFERDKEKIDILQDNQIDLMEIGSELRVEEGDEVLDRNKDLFKFQERYIQKRQERGFQHQVEQAALDRAARETNIYNQQQFEIYMREEAQKFTKDQNLIDQLILSHRFDVDNAQRTRALDLQAGQLDLARAQAWYGQQIDGFNAYTKRIDATLQKVGSESKTATLNYLTRNLKGLADGTLGRDQQNLYEQVLLDYASPKLDPISQTITRPSLSPAIEAAVKLRDKREGNSLLGRIREAPPPGTPFSGLSPNNMQEGGVVDASQFIAASPMRTPLSAGDRINVRDRAAEQNSLDRFTQPELTASEVQSPEFNVSLLKRDGSVNLDSPSWRAVPTTIFDPEVKYEVATGLGGGLTRLSNYFVETTREISGGRVGPMGPEGSNLVQADRDLIGLKNKLLMEITNFADDRVLKFVQEELAKDVEGLRPGLFKSDEKALATLNTLSKTLGTAFNSVVKGLPEYGGNARLFRPAEVTRYRAKAETLKGLIAETIAFKDSYEAYLAGLGGRLNPDQRAEAREFLANLGKK